MGANIGPINLVAPGLLGLFQLKQFGKNPDELAGVVTPIVELRDWYMQARVEDEISLFGGLPTVGKATASPGTSNFAFGGNPATVPQGQVWYIVHMNVSCNLLAAETIRMAPALTRSPTGQVLQVGTDANDVVTARARNLTVDATHTPFWARQGDTFALQTFDDLTAGTITVNLFLRAVRIPV